MSSKWLAMIEDQLQTTNDQRIGSDQPTTQNLGCSTNDQRRMPYIRHRRTDNRRATIHDQSLTTMERCPTNNDWLPRTFDRWNTTNDQIPKNYRQETINDRIPKTNNRGSSTNEGQSMNNVQILTTVDQKEMSNDWITKSNYWREMIDEPQPAWMTRSKWNCISLLVLLIIWSKIML